MGREKNLEILLCRSASSASVMRKSRKFVFAATPAANEMMAVKTYLIKGLILGEGVEYGVRGMEVESVCCSGKLELMQGGLQISLVRPEA